MPVEVQLERIQGIAVAVTPGALLVTVVGQGHLMLIVLGAYLGVPLQMVQLSELDGVEVSASGTLLLADTILQIVRLLDLIVMAEVSETGKKVYIFATGN